MRKLIRTSIQQVNFEYFIHKHGKSTFVVLIWVCSILIASATVFVNNLEGWEDINDIYPEITIPVYPNAKDIKKYLDVQAGIKSKSYTVKLVYPAKEIVTFYETALRKSNFKLYKKEEQSLKDKWIVFRDGTRTSVPWVRQFSKVWINEDITVKAILVLHYETLKRNYWIDELFVTLQIMPLIDLIDEQSLDRFWGEVKKDGKLEQFMGLLKRYSTFDENVDFDKAIKENPDNPYLREYHELIKKILNKRKNH